MTVLELLKKSRALLAEPGRFCQGATARTRAGVSVAASGNTAWAFCGIGAPIHVAKAVQDPEARGGLIADALAALRAADCERPLNQLADAGSQGTALAAVLARYDRAIAGLEKAAA